jgi:hypothetical protein
MHNINTHDLSILSTFCRKSYHYLYKLNQGTITKGKGPVRLTTSIRQIVLLKGKKIFLILKPADLNN